MDKFSEREIEILEYVALGLTNTQIAKKINVSSHTVKAYIASIIRKLNAINRTHATYLAVKNKLINL